MKFLVLFILGVFAALSTCILDLKARVDYLEDNLPKDTDFWGRFSE